MHRAGIPESKALPLLQDLAGHENITLTGMSTTLTEDPEFDRSQLDRFLNLSKQARNRGIDPGLLHAASSAGVFGSTDYFLDMVRPGIVLYGGYPNTESQKENRLELKPVLSFKARVAEVKRLKPGDGVSYHRAYRAGREETIAVLPVGYSDGYPPPAAGKGHVLIGGLPCPIIASVTANHMEVRLPERLSVRAGDEVVLIGDQGQNSITADDVAGWAGSSNYRILIGMNPRLPRIVSPS
jgi:alanine racemase